MDVKPLKVEIEKRRESITALTQADADLSKMIADYTKLDAGFQSELDTSRVKLEGIYLESRHYSASWPIVYSNTLVNKYPFYSDDKDENCNPYFRASAVKAGNQGIEPIDAPITRNSPAVYNRVRSYGNESVQRSAALSALNAYPDHSNEPLIPFTCVGASGSFQMECELNGGVWTPTVWVPELTAVGLLKSALNPWKDNITTIISNIYNSAPTVNFWQQIKDEITNCISLLPPEPTYPNQTPNPSGALLTSINLLKGYAGASTNSFVSTRLNELNGFSTSEESKFFGIIKLRLHFANGSFTKLKLSSNQKGMNASLIKDHKEAIISLTNIIISQ